MIKQPSVYLAARYARIDEMRSIAESFRGRGIFVTSRWLKEGVDPNHSIRTLSAEYMQTSARHDLEDIDAADYLVLFSEDPDEKFVRGGRHVEFGYALAKGKKIIVVGPKENIFHYEPNVLHTTFSWHAADYILKQAPRKALDDTLRSLPFNKTFGKIPASDAGYVQPDGKLVLTPGQGKVYERTSAPLPSDAKERKTYPMFSGLLAYFPDALAEVSHISYIGNQQHSPGSTKLVWVRGKSTDHKDTLVRHLAESGKRDSDGQRHSAKVAWRALANLQEELEAEKGINAADNNQESRSA